MTEPQVGAGDICGEPTISAGDICGEPTITVGDLWCYLIDRMLSYIWQ